MSNSLDPDHARRIVGPDLDPNCLPRLSADDTGRQRVYKYKKEDRPNCTIYGVPIILGRFGLLSGHLLETAAHSNDHMFSSYFDFFVIFIISRFCFECWIWVLILFTRIIIPRQRLFIIINYHYIAC